MRIAPMGDDLFPIIDDAVPSCSIAGFIERVLIAAIDAHLAQHDARHFFQVPSHPAPIDPAHDGGKVSVIGFLVEELCEYFQRTAEALRFAALPMNGCVGIVQPLNPTPGECSDVQRVFPSTMLYQRRSAPTPWH